MTETTCPRCQFPVPTDRGAHECPRCLLRVGLEPDEHATVGSAASLPGVDFLAEHFPNLEIHACIGRGGMGAVYKARQPKLDRWVALKILTPELARDPAFIERFEREAQALARLRHPNIVAVHDFGVAGETCYLLMEYVDGPNLRQLMQPGKLPPEDALALVAPVCEALQYAHDHGVVHRDVKPENILVDGDGCVKIADFGLALLSGAAEGVRLTGTYQAMGTPHYVAPEQLSSARSVDHRADIYSLGIVFYELLTGELPLGRFDLPSQKVQVDVRLDDVVLKALQAEPDRRYQKASEVKLDIDRVSGSDAPVAPAPGRTSSRPEQPEEDEILGMALVLGVLVLIYAAIPTTDSWFPLLGLFLPGLAVGESLADRSLDPWGRGFALVTLVLSLGAIIVGLVILETPAAMFGLAAFGPAIGRGYDKKKDERSGSQDGQEG